MKPCTLLPLVAIFLFEHLEGSSGTVQEQECVFEKDSKVVLTLQDACNVADGCKQESFKVPLVTIGKGKYAFHLKKMSFYRAMRFCKMNDMELVTFETQQELNDVGQYIKNNHGGDIFFTSGTDLGSNKGNLKADSPIAEKKAGWYWQTTGAPIANDIVWAGGEPTTPRHVTPAGEAEHCVIINWARVGNALWDYWCSYPLNVICEAPCNGGQQAATVI